MCSRIGSGSARLLDFPSLQVGLLICLIDFLIGLAPDLIESLKLLVRNLISLIGIPYSPVGVSSFGSFCKG